MCGFKSEFFKNTGNNGASSSNNATKAVTGHMNLAMGEAAAITVAASTTIASSVPQSSNMNQNGAVEPCPAPSMESVQDSTSVAKGPFFHV